MAKAPFILNKSLSLRGRHLFTSKTCPENETKPPESVVCLAKIGRFHRALKMEREKILRRLQKIHPNIVIYPNKVTTVAQITEQDSIDEDLRFLWKAIQGQIKCPDNLNAAEIRLWMSDPTNQDALSQIKNVSILSRELSSLPPEIGLLTQSQELDLSYNQTGTIPPEIREELSTCNIFL